MIIDNRPTWSRVLSAIEAQPAGITTGEIAVQVYVTANAVGHHLRRLEKANLIKRTKAERGNTVYWSPK